MSKRICDACGKKKSCEGEKHVKMDILFVQVIKI